MLFIKNIYLIALLFLLSCVQILTAQEDFFDMSFRIGAIKIPANHRLLGEL